MQSVSIPSAFSSVPGSAPAQSRRVKHRVSPQARFSGTESTELVLAATLVAVGAWAGSLAFRGLTSLGKVSDVKVTYARQKTVGDQLRFLLPLRREYNNPLMRKWAYQQLMALPINPAIRAKALMPGLHDDNVSVYQTVLKGVPNVASQPGMPAEARIALLMLVGQAPKVQYAAVEVGKSKFNVPYRGADTPQFADVEQLCHASLDRAIAQVMALPAAAK